MFTYTNKNTTTSTNNKIVACPKLFANDLKNLFTVDDSILLFKRQLYIAVVDAPIVITGKQHKIHKKFSKIKSPTFVKKRIRGDSILNSFIIILQCFKRLQPLTFYQFMACNCRMHSISNPIFISDNFCCLVKLIL